METVKMTDDTVNLELAKMTDTIDLTLPKVAGTTIGATRDINRFERNERAHTAYRGTHPDSAMHGGKFVENATNRDTFQGPDFATNTTFKAEDSHLMPIHANHIHLDHKGEM